MVEQLRLPINGSAIEGTDEALAQLTEGERRVWYLKHPEDGVVVSNREIGRRLGMSTTTARKNLKGIEDRLAAVRRGPHQ